MSNTRGRGTNKQPIRTFSSVSDLRTVSEDRISSQATVYTQRTQQTTVTSGSQDDDEFQDIISNPLDTLQITPEEEKKIQNILEFARKGKINPQNAFELPIKVIDPLHSNSLNTRFWKFASELLFASSGVYDKRVQNIYQNTNRMFDSLVRATSRPDEAGQQEAESQQGGNKKSISQIDPRDVGKVKSMASYQKIGQYHTQDPEKLNVRNQHKCFSVDPLFSRQLKSFDNSSMDKYFLNIFPLTKDLNIGMNCTKKVQIKEEDPAKMEVEELKEEVKQEEEAKIQSSIENEKLSQSAFREVQKANLILASRGLFRNFGVVEQEKEYIRSHGERGRHEVGSCLEQLQEMFSSRPARGAIEPMPIYEESQPFDSTQPTQPAESSSHFAQSSFQFNEESQVTQDSSQMPTISKHAFSESFSRPMLEFYDESVDCRSAIHPWQWEFKGMQLVKKKPKPARRQGAERRKKDKEEVDIDFEDGVLENRKQILKVKVEHQGPSQPYDQRRHMAPISYDNPKLWNRDNPRLAPGASSQPQLQQHEHPLPERTFLQDDHILPEPEGPSLQIEPLAENQMESENIGFHNMLTTQNSNSMGSQYGVLRNVRQLKQRIFDQLQLTDCLRLSEIQVEASFSSVMAVFLYLVNERNLLIEPIDNETDLLIRLKK